MQAGAWLIHARLPLAGYARQVRIDTRAQADELVRSLTKRARSGLFAALEAQRAAAKLDPHHAYVKELTKRLKLGPEYADLGAVAWALVGEGLVERQSAPLWSLLAEGASHGTLDDLGRLLDGVSAPGEEHSPPFWSSYLPDWSAALDLVSFGVCQGDLSPLVARHATASGPLRVGLGTVLVRAGIVRGRDTGDDWGRIFARYLHLFPDASPCVVASDAEGDHVLWPGHARARDIASGRGRGLVVPREAGPALARPYVRELLTAFCDLDELRERLDAEALRPTPVRKPRAKDRAPAQIASPPSYSEVVWVYGRRAREGSPSSLVAAAREVAEGALDFGPGFPGAGLYGAFPVPVPPHVDEKALAAGTRDAILGTILNGSPIVRAEPEMREGLLATLHEVTPVAFRHLGSHLGIQDVHESHETTWDSAFRRIVDDAMPEGPPVAWHLVAREGHAGALVYGCLLPGQGGGYDDDLVSTRLVRDETGSVVARLVGATIATVDATRPIATIEAELGRGDPERQVEERIATLTGRARPCRLWLHRGS